MTIPAWIVPILIKIVLPMVLAELQRLGLSTEVETIAAKFGLAVIGEIEGIKIYSKITDYPQSPNTNPAPSNLKVEQPKS